MPASGYLFVYGTLRKNRSGGLHPFLQGQPEFIGYATLPGRLYEVRNYPAAMTGNNSNERIHGEIYRLHDTGKLFQILDDYEECSEKFPKPHEYRRCQTTVYLSDNRAVLAWVYLYNWPVAELKPIVGGDYLVPVQVSTDPFKPENTPSPP